MTLERGFRWLELENKGENKSSLVVYSFGHIVFFFNYLANI